MKEIKIKLFGNFEITADGNVVLEQLKQARKTNLFIQYLILKKGAPVSHEELLDMLWSDRESSNSATALRTLLHRYRNLIEESGIEELKDSIVTTRGFYRWNAGLPCSVDVYEMEQVCQRAADAALSKQARIEKYLRVLEIYTGPLLGGSSEEMWVVPKSVYYHDMYLEAVFKLIALLKEDKAYDTIIQVSRKALEVELFDERLHLELMLALTKAGKKREAISQYYFVSDLTGRQLGIQPSAELKAMYKQLVRADTEMDADIEKVQAMLEENDDDKGAFVCQYEIFCEIYQLQRRMIERYNGTMFLALFTISNALSEDFDALVLDKAMRDLLAVLQISLRRGDTVSRYSAAQYVLLLPSVTFETGKMVLERVKKAFYHMHLKSPMMLNYKLRPLHISKHADKQEKSGKRPISVKASVEKD